MLPDCQAVHLFILKIMMDYVTSLSGCAFIHFYIALLKDLDEIHNGVTWHSLM